MSDKEYGATITPTPSSAACGATGYNETALLAHVDPDNDEAARTLCPDHRVEYLREVYDR
jgi:hypothetical protein